MEERSWYVVQTSPGFENAVKRNLERRIDSMKMADKIFNVLVPEQTIVSKTARGEVKEVVETIHPGYVFVDMIVTDETWFMVRNTPSVTGFLGSSGGGAKPVPLSNEEIQPILKACGLTNKKAFAGKIGSKVEIVLGEFAGQIGTISAIDDSKQVLKVVIEGFGGGATLELFYDDVKVIDAN